VGGSGNSHLSTRTLYEFAETRKEEGLIAQEQIERATSTDFDTRLFFWTLTHPSRAFSEVKPVFNSQEEFVEFVSARLSGARMTQASSQLALEIRKIALEKIDSEWRSWVALHEDLPFGEHKLDNMLMSATYRVIIDRDLMMCVLCKSSQDLTIHHIIQKRRNISKVAPPFGRSVPTNLVTLCRDCHSIFDPAILI
jgi:HNH endonuclease